MLENREACCLFLNYKRKKKRGHLSKKRGINSNPRDRKKNRAMKGSVYKRKGVQGGNIEKKISRNQVRYREAGNRISHLVLGVQSREH